ncbi:hypothetical protein [Acetobacter orientalis]|uniref:hypothetical protein n=1 Tax=Acetobacter orientalis TaxID=146474 RepID=UPI000B9B1D43|nr:hypothetical protein [Acetobacter orientalis]
MPLYPYAKTLIKSNLIQISLGNKVYPVAIGRLTDKQYNDINLYRSKIKCPGISDPEVLYLGRHHCQSRFPDGYDISDLYLQIENSMSANSVVVVGNKMTTMENRVLRFDGYKSNVRDVAVLELMARRPNPELFSVIPKEDIKPKDINEYLWPRLDI